MSTSKKNGSKAAANSSRKPGRAPAGILQTNLTQEPSRTSIRFDDRPRLTNPILVIHQGGWAEVLGEATLNLVAGSKELEVIGLPDESNFVAGSLRVDGISGPGEVTESEINYEPPTRGGLAELLRTMPVVVEYQSGRKLCKAEGRLLSRSGNTVDLQIGYGTDAVVETINNVVRVQYPCLPSNFRTEPAVLLTAESDVAGEYLADLRLMTRGLGWTRSYDVELDRDAGTFDVKGIYNLVNTAGVDFFGADVLVVSGETGSPEEAALQDDYQYEGVRAAAAPMRKSVRTVDSQAVDAGDVKIDILPRKYTVRQNAQKTVIFFSAQKVPCEVEYRVNLKNRWWLNAGRGAPKAKVGAFLLFKNEEGGKLGRSLLSGAFNVREKGQSESLRRSMQAGQGALADLPVNEEGEVRFTTAIDILCDLSFGEIETVTQKVKGNPDKKEQKYELRPCEVKLTNRSKRTARVVVEDFFDEYGEVQKNNCLKVKSGNVYEGKVELAPGESKTLKYTVKVAVNN